MGKGLPDWYTGIDIAIQTLAEVQQRHMLGLSKTYNFTATVTKNVTTDLVTISGSGNIIAAICRISPSYQIEDSYFYLTIDGEAINDWTVIRYRDHLSIIHPYGIFSYPVIDDNVNIYVWTLKVAMSFDSSLIISFVEADNVASHLTLDAIIGIF